MVQKKKKDEKLPLRVKIDKIFLEKLFLNDSEKSSVGDKIEVMRLII